MWHTPWKCLDRGDAGVFVDEADQFGAAARDDQVDVLVHAQQAFDLVAIGERQLRYRVGGHSVFGQRRAGEFGQHFVRVRRFAAAFQDAGVAGFEAERERVHGDVRPGLVDHHDHAQRRTDLAHVQASGGGVLLGDGADRVVERRHLAQAGGHLSDGRVGELQPAELGGAGSRFAGGVHVRRVGLFDPRGLMFDLVRQHQQTVVLGFGRGHGDGGGRRARCLGHLFNG